MRNKNGTEIRYRRVDSPAYSQRRYEEVSQAIEKINNSALKSLIEDRNGQCYLAGTGTSLSFHFRPELDKKSIKEIKEMAKTILPGWKLFAYKDEYNPGWGWHRAGRLPPTVGMTLLFRAPLDLLYCHTIYNAAYYLRKLNRKSDT